MTTNHAGPLQSALARMTTMRDDSDTPEQEAIFQALIATLTALIPASQLAIDTSQRAIATDRDVGILAERLQAAERRLDSSEDTVGWKRSTGSASLHERVVNLTENLGLLERDLRDLTARDQLTTGKIDGLRTRLERTVTDLRGAEGAIGELHKQAEDGHGAAVPAVELLGDGLAVHTLHIEHLHVGDMADEDGSIGRREVMGAAIAADLVAARRRRDAADARPITPELISRSSGEELDWIADRLGLARKDQHDSFSCRSCGPCVRADEDGCCATCGADCKINYGEPEADEPLRLRCGAELFRQHMTRECAEAILRQAKAATPGGHGPGWRAAPWAIDAIMAAAGAGPMLGGKDPELAEAIKASNHRANALQLALGHSGNDSTWASMITAVETLRRERDDLQRQNMDLEQAIGRTRADRDRLLQTSNKDVEGLARELGDLRTQRAELNAALDRAHAQADGDRSALEARAVALKTTQAQIDKFMSACGDQAIQIMELRGEVRRLTSIADRAKAADMLIAAMPAWAEMADKALPLSYERPLLRVWGEVKKLVTPEVAPGPTEIDPVTEQPLSGL